MFLLFHIAVPLLIVEILLIIKPIKIDRFTLLIGSLLPDLIDKPLSFMEIGNGRFIDHAPFLYIPFFLLFLFFIPNKNLIYTLFFGIYIHLILDIPYLPFLWPFVAYSFLPREDYFSTWINILLNDPTVLLTEICGLIILFGISFKYHLLFHWANIRFFLFNEKKAS